MDLMAPEGAKEEVKLKAEIIRGTEECSRHVAELLRELGFPKGVLFLKDLEEFGIVRETGFVWMKFKAPYKHFFAGTNTLARYASVVTAYVEKFKMKEVIGVKSKKFLLWVPIVEMRVEDPDQKKIHFSTSMGIGKSFPITAFMNEEEKQEHLDKVSE